MPNAKGFTMLELLLATALIALLAGSLYASLRVGMRAGQGALAAVDPTRRAMLAMDLVVQDLQAAAVPRGILAGAFVGEDGRDSAGRDSDSLTFYAIAPAGTVRAGAGDVRAVELSGLVSPDGQEMMLIRGLTTNLLSPQLIDPGQEILCRGVRAFNLRYFDGTAWSDSWDSTTVEDVLPVAIEVTLEVSKGKEVQDGTISLTRIVPIPCGIPVDANSVSP